jgi:hypothetical protein
MVVINTDKKNYVKKNFKNYFSAGLNKEKLLTLACLVNYFIFTHNS